MPIRILLGGGIGSGKSTAASCFSDLGAVVVQADEVARGVLEPGSPAMQEVADRWPSVVVNGHIDRARLGRLVFDNPADLVDLEAITHPETRRRLASIIAEHGDNHLLLEIPIMRDWFGGEWSKVAVHAGVELRIRRVLAREPDMDRAAVEAIMARQPEAQEWMLWAEYVVDNGGSPIELSDQCARVWGHLTIS